MKSALIIEGVDLETAYNKDLFPNGILGLNADYVNQYVQYVADRRWKNWDYQNTTMLQIQQNGWPHQLMSLNW
jgi:ribonucleotide reductase beta subunit family protein with ferritin-like domain